MGCLNGPSADEFVRVQRLALGLEHFGWLLVRQQCDHPSGHPVQIAGEVLGGAEESEERGEGKEREAHCGKDGGEVSRSGQLSGQ
jgi:hypothetical protein